MFRAYRSFHSKPATNALILNSLSHLYNQKFPTASTSRRHVSSNGMSDNHSNSSEHFDIDHYMNTDNYDKKRVMIENRTSIWCRRIWELSKHIQTIERQRETQKLNQSGNKLNALLRHDAYTDDGATNRNCATESEEKRHAILSELQKTIGEERKGEVLPAAVIDTIWAVYDDLFPPRLQYAVNNTINNNNNNNNNNSSLTPKYVDHFFSFIHVLTQSDFDVDGVAALSAQLSAEVEKYKLLQKEKVNDTPSEGGDPLRELKLKNKIIELCFDVRTTGSPLHYVWLRHSAAKEGGTRRLMEFRKTLHFFDIECSKQIQQLRKHKQTQQQSAGLADEAALRFWQSRRNDIATVDGSLRNLFHDFFAKEYLVMEELRWYSTAPSLLEHVMAAENVHPFANGFADLKKRMQPTHHRHCFAFLHPSVIEEPLIAVQVALTRDIIPSVDVLLGRPSALLDSENTSAAAVSFRKKYEKEIGWYRTAQPPHALSAQTNNNNNNKNNNIKVDEKGANIQNATRNSLTVNLDPYYNEDVNTAIFYSINSAQSALRGMDMGNLLIKRVVQEVQENVNLGRKARHLPPIEKFSTLSPIPGYTRWLSAEVEKLNTRAALMESAAAANNNNNSDNNHASSTNDDDGSRRSFLDAKPFGAPPPASPTDTTTAAAAAENNNNNNNNDNSESGNSANAKVDVETFYQRERALYQQLRAAVLDYGRRHLTSLTEDDQHSVAKLEKLQTALGEDKGSSYSGGGKTINFSPFVALETRANAQAFKFFLRLLLDPHPASPWFFDGAFATAIEAPLMASIAHYLLREKRRSRVLDPVGNFHLANGAMVRRLNFLGNCSAQGSRESGTVMVNYHYEMPEIGSRVSAYALRHEAPAAAEVHDLLIAEKVISKN